MLQLLVVYRSHENVSPQGFPRYPRGQKVFARVAEPLCDKFSADIARLVPSKGSRIPKCAFVHCKFSTDELDHFTDGHPGGKTMRVHDEVWADPPVAEGHVFLVDNKPTDAFL